VSFMRIRVLDRKLLRDLWRLKWQVAAIALLIACGVSVAVMAFSTQRSLVNAQSSYYAQTHFGNLFAKATRAPLSVAADLARIDGVVAVDPRATKSGLMEIPGLLRPATALLISLPDDDRRALNRIVIVAGRLPDPHRSDEAVALKTFLDAAHVSLGERLSVVIDEHRLTFTIVGAALSPEYVYVPSSSPMPDDAHQGVLWAPRDAVERPSGLGGAFSEVSLALAPNASESGAIAAIDRILAPHGGAPAYGREDQVSNKFQDDRIQRLGIMAVVLPPVFLIVAAALVNLVLGRLVQTEREQIGLLKAFGYGDLEAASIYLKMSGLVGVIGVVVGGASGGWLGQGIIGMLAPYMRFPHLSAQFPWAAFGVAAIVSIAAALAGSLLAVLRVVRMSPAVAMQTPAPTSFRKGIVERFGVWRIFDQPTRMIVRNLERFPARAALTVAGLSVSLALLVGSQFLFASVDEVVDQAYYRAHRWTDEIGFGDTRDVHVVTELAHLPAVLSAEPVRTEQGRMRANARQERIAVVGLDDGANLDQPLDMQGRPIAFEGHGVVLSIALAHRLAVRAGDFVELEIMDERRPRMLLPVTAIADDYAGLTAYMARNALNRAMGDGDEASGADLMVAPETRGDFYRSLARIPQVVGAASRDDTVASFRSAVTDTMTIEMTFFLGFAGAIAFGVAYNISRIALADRSRDLATLCVLGFGPGECAYILCGELIFLALLAMPVGVMLGLGLVKELVTAFTRQDFYLPFLITARGLAIAVTTYLGAVILATALVSQRIWRLDLVTVLKTRE
jgi:putative ABC transport system permease protein